MLPIVVGTAAWTVVEERARRALAQHTATNRDQAAKDIADYLARIFRSADPMPFEDAGFIATEPRSSDAAIRRILDNGRDLLQEHLADQPEIRAELLISMGNSDRSLADFATAAAALEESYRIRLERLGPDAAETLESQHFLGRLAYDQGDYAHAERIWRQVIAGRERLRPPQPLSVADTKYQLATLLYYQPFGLDLPQFDRAKVDESIQLFEEVVSARREHLPENDRALGMALVGLSAATSCIQEETPKALAYAASAHEVFRTTSGERTFGSVLLLYNEAERLRREQRFEEADARYRSILEQTRRTLGSRHPIVVLHLWNMAGMYRALGDYPRGSEVLTEIRATLRHLPGIRSQPAIVDAMMRSGDEMRRFDEATSREIYAEALAYAQERPDSNSEKITTLQQRIAEFEISNPR